jgi:hypothetical protein
MMRQSPKPYAKGKVRRTPPRPRSEKYCQGMPDLSTASCVEYQKSEDRITHLWGLSLTNHPFVLLAGRPVSIGYGRLSDRVTILLKWNRIAQSLPRTRCRARTR